MSHLKYCHCLLTGLPAFPSSLDSSQRDCDKTWAGSCHSPRNVSCLSKWLHLTWFGSCHLSGLFTYCSSPFFRSSHTDFLLAVLTHQTFSCLRALAHALCSASCLRLLSALARDSLLNYIFLSEAFSIICKLKVTIPLFLHNLPFIFTFFMASLSSDVI